MKQRMGIILWLLPLLLCCECAIYSKISTQFGNSLTQSDYLLSTMGLFRMTLNKQTCQLQMESFNGSNYGIVGYYPRTALQPCQSVSISNNSFLSNNNDPILTLQPTQIKTIYDQVFVSIDEMGIIRINGVYNKKYESSQNWISLFRTPRQFIYSISNLSVTLYNSLSFIQNNGNWGFSATNGELRLFRVDDVSKIIRYNYTSFTITPNNLFDYNSNSLPLANYNQFAYYSTCSSSGYLQNFQGPFVFAINSYWPELRLLDRNGYEIISLRFPDPHCLSLIGINYLHDTDSCMSWFCPTNTFELNGDCLATCPSPYFHQLGKNGINRCVINCQANFNKDNIRRVCACGELPTVTCPAALKSTPFGCLCSKNTYWNTYNQLKANDASQCYSSCGPFLFAHKDGICVPCPKYCEICVLSQNSFNYLSCSICEAGFHVNSDGFCIKNCNRQIASSSSTVCPSCAVNNCDNCSESISTCISCNKPYSLHNNTCLVQCPKGYKSVFDRMKGFRCTIVPGCSAQSTMVSDINNQSSCFCIRNGNPSYAKNCGTIEPSSCDFDNYFDNNTIECLMCPVGCLTCVLDRNSKIECTSCRPDYSLFITLSKNHYCERNSILSICPNNYDYSEQICSISNLNQVVATLAPRNMCFPLIANCMICVAGSATQCSICGQNSFQIKGKCVRSCPDGMNAYQFQRVCIPTQKDNCLAETTQNAYWLFIKNKINQYSDGYFYLISPNFQANDYLNDPLGSIFTYLKSPDIQSKNKMVNIATSYQKCAVCQVGFGLTSNGKCLKCIFPCLQCVYYSKISPFCLKCHFEYRLTADNTCKKLNITELPCKDGEFRNESRMCQSDCLSYYRSNYSVMQDSKSYPINCTVNCPNGFTVSTYLNDNNEQRLNCSQNAQDGAVAASIKFLGSMVRLSSFDVYMLISSNPLSYANGFSADLSVLSAPSGRRLADSSNNSSLTVYPVEFGLIIVDDSQSQNFKSMIVKLPAARVSSIYKGANIYLYNSIYGFDSSSKPFIDIILNQTSNLYFYGRAYIVVIFLLTIIFLAEKINYKTDNLFITFSVIYLVLPSLNLKPDSSSFNAYSFLYGFAWSTHLQFLSNPRSLTQGVSWFDHYLERSSNNAHYLLYIDNNIIRNAWSIFIILIIVVASLLLIALIIKCFSVSKLGHTTAQNQKNCCSNFLTKWSKIGYNASDFNHGEQIKYLILFLLQNSIIGIAYYSAINIANTSWDLAPSQKQTVFKALSFVLLSLIVIYSLLRIYANRIGGLYCFKRLLLGVAFGVISQNGGVDQNIGLSLALLITIQALFAIMRYRVQFLTNYIGRLFKGEDNTAMTPPAKNKIRTRHTIAEGPKYIPLSDKNQPEAQKSTAEASQFWIMVVQQILIIIVYIFVVLVNSLKEVSILIVWIILNAFMINFGVEFVDLIVDFWNKTYNRHVAVPRPFEKAIRNNWDHELSLKSLATTADL